MSTYEKIKEGKVGVEDTICLITITIVAKVFYTSPATLTQIVGPASWYLTLISASTGIFAFYFVVKLLQRFPDKNLLQIYDEAFGRVLGFLMSFILMVWLLYIASMNMREFTDVIIVYALPTSPPLFIMLHFAFAIALICLLGFEVLTRVSKFFFYGIGFGLILVLILCIQNYDYHRIFPILGYGLGKTIYHGFMRSSVYGEIILLAVFASSFQGLKHIKKIGYKSLILSGLVISISMLAFIMTFPYTIGGEQTAPMYVMISIVDYGMFFQRLEAVFLFVWYLTTLISISALCYTALYIFCSIFEIKDKRPIIFPLLVVFLSLAFLPDGISSIVYGSIPQIRSYGWIVFYIGPILALIIAAIRKKRGDEENAS